MSGVLLAAIGGAAVYIRNSSNQAVLESDNKILKATNDLITKIEALHRESMLEKTWLHEIKPNIERRLDQLEEEIDGLNNWLREESDRRRKH